MPRLVVAVGAGQGVALLTSTSGYDLAGKL